MSNSQLLSLASWGVLLLVCTGCPEQRDPLAEHLLAQRNKAVKQLEERANRDKSLDILCWDISQVINKPTTIQRWALGQKDLDVLALTGPDIKKLQAAANMEEVMQTLERGWPVVSNSNQSNDAKSNDAKTFSVINSNGYRFEGVMTDPIEGWEQADSSGRADPPPVMHLQVKHTKFEVVLVYLTNAQAVSDAQLAALAQWIEAQKLPTIVFGDFPTDKLTSESLVPLKPGRVSITKPAESWNVRVEEVESPIGQEGPQPMIVRCTMPN